MENTRRKLRNNNNCPDLSNIFNPRLHPSRLHALLPQSIMGKISSTQKVTCNTILQTVQFLPPRDLKSALESCRGAQQYQKQWEHELMDGCPMEEEKVVVTNSTEVKQEGKGPFYLEAPFTEAGSTKLKGNQQVWIPEEPCTEKKDIWSDAHFIESLNSFLNLEPNRGSMWTNQDFFMK